MSIISIRIIIAYVVNPKSPNKNKIIIISNLLFVALFRIYKLLEQFFLGRLLRGIVYIFGPYY